MGKLSNKRQRFVREYLVDFNATAAAIRAGYSKRTARMAGSRLMTNDDVSASVAAAQQKVAEKLDVTVEEVLKFWADTMRDKAVHLDTRIAASDKLGKALAMYSSKVHVTGSLSLLDLLAGADKTAETAETAEPMETIQ